MPLPILQKTSSPATSYWSKVSLPRAAMWVLYTQPIILLIHGSRASIGWAWLAPGKLAWLTQLCLWWHQFWARRASMSALVSHLWQTLDAAAWAIISGLAGSPEPVDGPVSVYTLRVCSYAAPTVVTTLVSLGLAAQSYTDCAVRSHDSASWSNSLILGQTSASKSPFGIAAWILPWLGGQPESSQIAQTWPSQTFWTLSSSFLTLHWFQSAVMQSIGSIRFLFWRIASLNHLLVALGWYSQPSKNHVLVNPSSKTAWTANCSSRGLAALWQSLNLSL